MGCLTGRQWHHHSDMIHAFPTFFRATCIIFLALLSDIFRIAFGESLATVSSTNSVPAHQVAGAPFDIDVIGSGFDTQNDKVMLIQSDLDCGMSFPPAGEPGSVSEYAAIACDGPGSAPTRLWCSGLTLFARGSWTVCVCDADGNASAVLPTSYLDSYNGTIATSGCNTKERFFLGSANTGLIYVDGPDFAGIVDRRAGAPQDFRITGTGFRSSDKIRITSANTICTDRDSEKNVHSAVHMFSESRSSTSSTSLRSIWQDVSVNEPGTYQVCWCGRGLGGCDGPEDFVVHAATLQVAGPFPTPQFCITGVQCNVEVAGVGLNDDDRIIFIPSFRDCGLSVRSNYHLRGGKDARFRGGPDFSLWAGIVMSMSADFKLCWCGRGDTTRWLEGCSRDEDFNVWAGNVTVRGPRQNTIARPNLGEPFSYYIEGWGLTHRDRITLVDPTVACASEKANIMSAGVWPSSVPTGPPAETWGDDPDNQTEQVWNDVILTQMQDYRVCWCGRFFMGCTKGAHFALDIGLIQPLGPKQNVSVIAATPGRPFEVPVYGVLGSNLTNRDRIRIVEKEAAKGTCGKLKSTIQASDLALEVCFPTCEPTVQSHAPAVASDGLYEVWDPIMITAGGTFLVCWCSAMTGGCSSNQDFVVQVAEIVVQGVKQGQTWTCVAYHACNIQVPREGNLAAGER